MQNTFEEIREQIHEIRNMLGPIDIKLDNLDHKITAGRISSESRTADLEAKISAESIRVSEFWAKISDHSDQLAQQSERIRRIELLLKIPQTLEKAIPASASASAPAPVREDKVNPEVIPPQKPQA